VKTLVADPVREGNEVSSNVDTDGDGNADGNTDASGGGNDR
jgi:hypothetical protein